MENTIKCIQPFHKYIQLHSQQATLLNRKSWKSYSRSSLFRFYFCKNISLDENFVWDCLKLQKTLEKIQFLILKAPNGVQLKRLPANCCSNIFRIPCVWKWGWEGKKGDEIYVRLGTAQQSYVFRLSRPPNLFILKSIPTVPINHARILIGKFIDFYE